MQPSSFVRLTAGGDRIRTIGPALVKGLSPVADERCRTDKLDGSLSTGRLARRRWSAAGPLSTTVSFSAGPTVRIRFSPAGVRCELRERRLGAGSWPLVTKLSNTTPPGPVH